MGVFVNQRERVTLISLNSALVATIREITDSSANIFKTVIANGPLLYFTLSLPFLLEAKLALGSLALSSGRALLVI